MKIAASLRGGRLFTMIYIDEVLRDKLTNFFRGGRKLTLLTGAGLSADSGIPTFRDTDGFWTLGSVNYMPEEIGTLRMFKQHPLQVWAWVLYRHALVSKALPNSGHAAIKTLEDIFEDRFRLITQNVDSLHIRAQSSLSRMYEIHGTYALARCSGECTNMLYSFPDIAFQKGEAFTPEQIAKLKCPACGNYLRPHTLWFDEQYNEKYYKIRSVLRVAKETGVLLIVGTSGATTLPQRVVTSALSRHAIVVDINTRDNWFSNLLQDKKNGYVLRGKAGDILPELVSLFRGLTDK